MADDAQWHSLCNTLGQPSWATEERFIDASSRLRHREELDRLVGDATAGWDAHELMERLQDAGVPAGAVLDGKDLLFDKHLMERRFFEVVSHHTSTGMPPLPYVGRPWKMSGTPAVPGRAAPVLGEHNEFMLVELLGRDREELAALERDGVIGYAPATARPVARPPLDEQVRQGRMQRYDTDFREQVERAHPPQQ